MKRRTVFSLLLILCFVQIHPMKGQANMDIEKMIIKKAKEISNQKFTPDTISGLWDISTDKKISSFGVEKAPYILLIDKTEKAGFAVFYDVSNGNIIERVPMTIKRIENGEYQIKYKSVIRKFKIVYYESDGTLYLHYDDSSQYSDVLNSPNRYSALLETRDTSEESIKKMINKQIYYHNLGE